MHRIFRLTAPILLVAALAVGLQGCGRNAHLQETRASRMEGSFQQQDKAVIVLGIERFTPGRGTVSAWSSNDMSMSLYNRTPVTVMEDGEEVRKSVVHLYGSDPARVAVIDPGVYALIGLYREAGNSRVTYSTDPWNPATGKPMILGFTVAAGDVVYLGHLVIQQLRDGPYKLALSVEDRPADAREALEDEFDEQAPAIVAAMQTRLVTPPAKAW